MLSRKFYKVSFITVAVFALVAGGLGGGTLFAARSGSRTAKNIIDAAAKFLGVNVNGVINMPIGIRGGSMTLRYDDGRGYVSGSSISCFLVQPATVTPAPEIEIDNALPSDQNFTPPTKPAKATASTSFSVTPPWRITMYARQRDGSILKTEGLQLRSEKACKVPGGSPMDGVSFWEFNGSNPATLYTYDNPLTLLGEDGSMRVRYQNLYSNKTCLASPDSSGDEDMCEHMSGIQVEDKIGTPSQRTQYFYCTAGECQVGYME